MASAEKTKQAKDISQGIAGLGLIGGGYNGFCQAQSIPISPNLEGLIAAIPLLGAGALGFIMRAGFKEEYMILGEKGLEPRIEQAKSKAIKEGRDSQKAAEFEADMLSLRGLGAGAVIGGIFGAISTVIGYGAGYLAGYLTK